MHSSSDHVRRTPKAPARFQVTEEAELMKFLIASFPSKNWDNIKSMLRDNRVVVDDSVQPERYARSCVTIRAPAGPYEWLNRRVFVGTVASLAPSRKAVAIRVYMLT